MNGAGWKRVSVLLAIALVLAVVIGAFVILLDPIFEGLAVSLIFGAIASTVLTLIVVPGIYFLIRRDKAESDGGADAEVVQPAVPEPAVGA